VSSKKAQSVLVDTTFLIAVFTENYANHATAKKYYKYFIKHGVKMYLSSIVASEFHQKQSIVDILNSNNFIPLPYNIDDAVHTADIAFKLGGNARRGESKPQYKDDLKLMGQAEFNEIDFIITEDESTLARYCNSLSSANMFKPEVILLNKGFDGSHFNGGQSALIEVE
jgi:hypothetical protein